MTLRAIKRAIQNNDSDNKIFKRYKKITHDIKVSLLMSIHNSKVVLDSEINTYYLIDISTKQLPKLSESISSVISYKLWNRYYI